jgi:LysM repeat protein
MAAPMTPASPMIDQDALNKQTAIQRALDKTNLGNQSTARQKIDPKKGGSATYSEQYIKGPSEGFTQSDYGTDNGAAIPYQIGTKNGTLTVAAPKPPPVPKPTKTTAAPNIPKHSSYTVQRGDTLSGIAKKYGLNWQDIWNFNLKYRNPNTINTLKSRGPNEIFRGGTFYIPE